MENSTLHTRKDYLAGVCTHSEYYGQFVDQGVINRVVNSIGRDTILASTDPHFNDIALAKWDRVLIPVPFHIAAKIRDTGDSPTLSSAVCIAKEGARQIAGRD